MKLQKAKEIERTMRRSGLGYDKAPTFNLRVGPEPFFLSEESLGTLNQKGVWYREWLRISNEVYSRALGGDTSLGWVMSLVEDGRPSWVVDVQRKVFERDKTALPMFGRADQPNLHSAVEMQIPGSGWGYMLKITQAFAATSQEGRPWGEGLDIGFVQATRELSGKQNPRVLHVLHNDKHLREAEFFAASCSKLGIRMEVSLQDASSLEGVDIVRRPPLESLLSFPGGKRAVELYLQNKIQMEPPPNLLYDQKAATVLPFHPQTGDLYPEQVRELFAKSCLVARAWTPTLQGGLSWEAVTRLPRSKRQFILKYAGSAPVLRGNARAVFNLSDMSQAKSESLLRQALDSWEKDEPWMLQERVREKFPVTLFNGSELNEVEWYMRLTPMYFLGEEPHIIGGSATFRNFWKVSAGEDHLILAVYVR